MPRLRRLKNYDSRYSEIIREELNSSDDFDEIERNSSDDMDIEGTREIKSQRNWLATCNIISSISDERIKSSIQYYRELIKQFESELSARNTGLKLHITNDRYVSTRFSIGSVFLDKQEMFGMGQVKNKRYTKIQRTKTKGLREFVKKLKLSPKEQGELLRMWEEIINAKM